MLVLGNFQGAVVLDMGLVTVRVRRVVFSAHGRVDTIMELLLL